MKASLLLATVWLTVTQATDPPRQPHQPLGNGTQLLTFNETVVSPSFSSSSRSVAWLSGGEEDGQYAYLSGDGDLILENFVTGDSSVFVPSDQIPEDYYDYWISPDLSQVLWATNHTQQYRHSYFADYFILDVSSGESTALVDDQVGDVQYAVWSPIGNAIAYVRGNNIFVYNSSTTTQITFDGGPDMFHGVPDWVYEEEIFGNRYALWWSPDAQYIAYLSFNETGVPTFTIPYFMDNQPIAPSYPRKLELRYPKVSATNPTVEFSLLNLNTMENVTIANIAFDRNDTIIGEVAWVTDDHTDVIYRAYNRVQDYEKLVLVNAESGSTGVVRERDGSDGWLDNRLAISYIGAIEGNGNDTYYVDMSDESGWSHLYLYPVSGNTSIALTSGEWEVDAILKIDSIRQLIYYTSTEGHSTERHIYSVNYATLNKTALVDDTIPAYYSASFSSQGTYYLLSYLGPDVPYQELYNVNSSTVPLRTITNNTALYTKLQSYALPNITYFDLEHPDGFTMNVMQRLPPNFNASREYPVLFTPYGGPGAQQVSKRFAALNWNAYISSDPELEYITYTIDNRGTGYKGRAFRSVVSQHLGRIEPQDQIWAAQTLSSQFSFIDTTKIAMWGWSFGGYLTSKVLEADSGVFSMGLITAPVTDWRLYDSMYTERYMKTYEMNPAGYNETAVRNVSGFANVRGHFAIMHGTGDDNVHYQNSAALIDLLVGSRRVNAQKMKIFAFTDSAHSINYNGATQFLYRFLTTQLWEEKNRVEEASLRHQWSKKSTVHEEERKRRMEP